MATSAYWGDDYGYGWWVMTGDEIQQFAAQGRGGQRIGVFPSLGLVAVTLGGGIDSGHELLVTALVDPSRALPANPEGQQELRRILESITLPPQPAPAAALPPMAAKVSGRTWHFAPNPLGLATLRISFDAPADAGFRMTFFGDEPPREGRMGLDGVLRFFPGEDEITAGMREAWIGGQDFRAEYDGIAQIDAFDLALHFDGDRVAMQAKDRTYDAGVTLEGHAE